MSVTIECCKVCDALKIAIKRCSTQLEKIRNGTTEMPPTFPTDKIDIWESMQEERYEYLESFRSRLEFLLCNENRNEMSV